MRLASRTSRTIELTFALSKRLASGSLFTFVQGLPSLADVRAARALVGHEDARVIREFESSFAGLIGSGEAVAFAAGRMGFFALMKSRGIGPGDEVILLGYTCAVMANAVLRIGATPIYSDVDPSTFGSRAESIEHLITSRTQMIVAQHSFGYPCDIEPIAELARRRGVFLLEDCATTLGSTIDGQRVGSFGDAALFSTDHTKPLVTHTGGLIYSQDPTVIQGVQAEQRQAGVIGRERQIAMWTRMEKESRLHRPSGQLRLFALDTISGLVRPEALDSSFLSDDFSSCVAPDSYPYPAKMPTFLAWIGIRQVRAWPALSRARRQSLDLCLSALKETPVWAYLPGVLEDPRVFTIPLRLAWSHQDQGEGRQRLRTRITTEGTWFKSPISVATDPMGAYGYAKGSCPVAESIGPGMINIPMLGNEAEGEQLAAFVKSNFTH